MSYNNLYPQQGVIGMPIPKSNNQQLYNGQYPGVYPGQAQGHNMMMGQNYGGNPQYNLQQQQPQQPQPQQLGAPFYQQE